MMWGLEIVGGIERWIPVVVISLLALPVGLLVATALARTRQRGREGWIQSLAEVGMVVGTVPWLWMILTPIDAPRGVRAVPLLDIAGLLDGPPLTAFYQIGGNLLVFAAFGALAPIRWRISSLHVLAIAAAASLTVETLQYALDLGRVSSVDDVLLNAVGAGLAAAITSRLRWSARRRTSSVRLPADVHQPGENGT